ncbi:hypothetical protein GmHk_07G018629 [Glycine max]|nr:hypothetical protein GmHk_07G018629 [Glycine max]
MQYQTIIPLFRLFYEEKTHYKIWKRSNRLSLMLMKMTTLMSILTTMKFDGSHIMYEHVIEMTNITTRLKTLGMTVNENFLVQFILNSLSSEYDLMSYNTIKDKWNVHKLYNMLVQEKNET